MKKMNTSPISGMQELLPADQIVFDKFKSGIAETYHSFGYQEIETPVIERTEILLAKAGGDTEKQIYKVVKTTEASESADQALRFDHTVPLARYVVEHENDLVFPFKVSQVGANYRGERAQKGRFREFYQCDIDVIGRGELALEYDADVIKTLLNAFGQFELKTPVLVRLSNRKILSGLLRGLGLETKGADIYSIIDHAEKVSPEKTRNGFVEIGLNISEMEQILKFMNLCGDRAMVLGNLKNMGVDDELFNDGVRELDEVMSLLEATGLAETVVADMKIVRGLDYYTGTVFEFILTEYPEIGSVCGGGRYENLAEYFTDQKLPGVGGSIGLTRLFYALNEKGLVDNNESSKLDIAVVPISVAQNSYAMKVADELRKTGKIVTVVFMDKKLGDKVKYASKVAQNLVVIGEDEVAKGEYEVKEFN